MKRKFLVITVIISGIICFFSNSAKAQQQNIVYPCLGIPQYFSVPPGVTQITAEIVGSDGTTVFGTNRGGKGAILVTDIAVTPSSVLTIYAGCKTGYGFTRGGRSRHPFDSEFNQNFWKKGAGGGSSAILNQNTVLAVAGGGGSQGQISFFFTVPGGSGGDAILATGNGENGIGIQPGIGGTFGGAPTGDGTDGTFGLNTIGGGGGGGGGYDPNGGGGGAGGTGANAGSGGGGGGGKSYVNPSFINSYSLDLYPIEATESGYVRITYNSTINGHQLVFCNGATVPYTVPIGVRQLLVSGIGADGGGRALWKKSDLNYSLTANVNGNLGNIVYFSGVGGGIRGTIDVVPGELLQVKAGCIGGISSIGGALSDKNPGGAGGTGIVPGGNGGYGDKPPSPGRYGLGGAGGGGASGIKRASTLIFAAPGGGGGGGNGSADLFGCFGAEGGVGDGRNGGDASPCANKGLGGLTGGLFPNNGGDGCFFCGSGGGGGGGGFPNGQGGGGAGVGAAGGGGGGGGRFFVSSGSETVVQLDTKEYRRVAEVTLPDPENPRIQNGYTQHDESTNPQSGFVSITPIFGSPTPPVVTLNISPESPDGNNGWYRSNILISWQIGSDFPITTQTGCQSVTQTTDINNFFTACTAGNINGSTSKSTPFLKRDATLPTITAVAVQQGGAPYVYGTTTSLPVTVTFTCNDNLSGVASCPAPQTYGSSATVSGTVVDNAGNSRTVTFGNVVSDNQPPTISPITNQETPVNTRITSVPFVIGDAETSIPQLIVRTSSSNEDVIPNSLIVVNTDFGNPANKSLEIIPNNNKVGTSFVTVEVIDARGAKAIVTFLVNVKCGTITVQLPPSQIYGAFLNAPLFPTGGVAPYTFLQTGGTMPENLELDNDFARLVGGPLRAGATGAFAPQLSVTDANGCSNPVTVPISVTCKIDPVVIQANDLEVFSLRGAVEGACPNSTITFDGFLNNQELSIYGAINISKPLTIQGPGADQLTLKNVLPAGNNNNVISVGPINEAVTISGLTIKDGNAPNSFGGGIRSGADLTIKDSVITNNFGGRGGGIALTDSTKILTIINSTVSNNFAFNSNDFNGGGIMSNGALNLINSTVSGNTIFPGFNSGAGVYALSGLISNSTITNNRVDDSFGSVNMASGVYGGSANLIVRSSIIAANQNNGSFSDVRNLFTSSGFNLIGNIGSVTVFNQPTDQTGSNNLVLLDPMLAPLALNGGSVPTHAFISLTSPAIDRGFAFGLTTDQRGALRPFDNLAIPNAVGGDGSDIGAFEIAAPTAAMASISGKIITSDGRGISRALVILTLPTGETLSVLSNSFGYYRFDDIPVGQVYVLQVNSKQFSFAPQVITVNDDLSEVNFIAQ